jgi:hypothetical protein
VPADEPLEADAVVALDVHRSVDAEPGGRDRLEDLKWFPPALRSSPAGSLPDPPSAGARHALGGGPIEEAVRAEVAQNAALDEALEGEPVVGGEPGGLVEAYGSVGRLAEDAVEDDQVEVEPSGPGGEARSASRGSSARPPNDAKRGSENWGLRAEPKRCRKLTAPSCASGVAPGLVRRSVVRIAPRKIPRTAPATSGL